MFSKHTYLFFSNNDIKVLFEKVREELAIINHLFNANNSSSNVKKALYSFFELNRMLS